MHLLFESLRLTGLTDVLLGDSRAFSSVSLFPLAEEAAGAGRPDGSFVLPAETHSENQQVQPPAAGHSNASWLTQAQRHDPGCAALFGRVWPQRVRTGPHEH